MAAELFLSLKIRRRGMSAKIADISALQREIYPKVCAGRGHDFCNAKRWPMKRTLGVINSI